MRWLEYLFLINIEKEDKKKKTPTKLSFRRNTNKRIYSLILDHATS